MKSIPLTQIAGSLVDTLGSVDQPIVLVKDAQAVAMVIPLPAGVSEKSVDSQQAGQVQNYAASVVKPVDESESRALPSGVPIFGRCQGMLTIVSDDDEHLKDFVDYMP